MTIEQEIQTTIKAVIEAALDAAAIEGVSVYGIKTDNRNEPDDGDFDESFFPAIVIDTSTPIPIGHRSALADVPVFITVQSYIPKDRGRVVFSELTEAVFLAIHGIDDWSDEQSENPVVDINAMLFSSSEEPTTNQWIIEQKTTLSCSVCLKQGV